MYRQISKCTDKTPKKYYGGMPTPPPPPPPSGYASDVRWVLGEEAERPGGGGVGGGYPPTVGRDLFQKLEYKTRVLEH